MTAKSTKNLTVCISAVTPKVNTAVVPTAIAAVAASGSTPAGVKVTAPSLPAVGAVVKFADTGFTSLDGKAFIVTAITAGTSFTIGNLTLGTGTLGTSPKAYYYVDADDMTCLCLSDLSISPSTAPEISVGTYCAPEATITGTATTAGTFSFGGFVDVTASDYPALLTAFEDGSERYLRITLPSNGYIIFPVTISSLSYSLPVSGAIGFTGTGTLGLLPKHYWA